MTKITFLTVCICLILSINVAAQKHNFHFTTGGANTFNYEGQLTSSSDSTSRINFKFGGGERYHLGYTRGGSPNFETDYLGASLVMLSGKKSNFFELAMGFGYGWRKRSGIPDGNYVLMLANIGYRLESGAFLLRIGFGAPEILYLGVGMRI